MISFVVMGFEVTNNFGGFKSFAQYLNSSGEVASPKERLYCYSSAASRLIVWQLAYQCKNFCDSCIHGDGIIFLLHHAMTFSLAVIIDIFLLR